MTYRPAWDTGAGTTVDAYTADFTLTSAQKSHVSTNTGAAGAIVLTLPAITIGMEFRFVVTAAQYLKVQASGGATIYVDTLGSSANGYTRSNTVGSTLKLVAVSSTLWTTEAVSGSWSVDA